MNRRRKRPRPHTNHERWLVSYADFVTLLFAFFVVLYASAQIDKQKAMRLSGAIEAAFQKPVVFQHASTSGNLPSSGSLANLGALDLSPGHTDSATSDQLPDRQNKDDF